MTRALYILSGLSLVFLGGRRGCKRAASQVSSDWRCSAHRDVCKEDERASRFRPNLFITAQHINLWRHFTARNRSITWYLPFLHLLAIATLPKVSFYPYTHTFQVVIQQHINQHMLSVGGLAHRTWISGSSDALPAEPSITARGIL